MNRKNVDIKRRARLVSEGSPGHGPVIYWMSRDQRAADNWAMLWAQQEALAHKKSLVVVFCLVPDYPGASLRHYLFLLKGLAELQRKLTDLNIVFHLLEGDPIELLPRFLQCYDAHLLVSDFDPLRIKRRWQDEIKSRVTMPYYEVDSHNIIPAWVTSDKKEYAAYTIRPKIKRLLDDYLTEFPRLRRHPFDCDVPKTPVDVHCLAAGIKDNSIGELSWIQPGERAALKAMRQALDGLLPKYATDRNDPCRQAQSGLSPYLHFGHLSAQKLALLVTMHPDLPPESREAFLEELIVRRELADNFCLYEPRYDSFDGFHPWAQKSLNEHRGDSRDYIYPLTEFEQGRTHDPLWNSCQLDLVSGGKLHGYLRMYWAKKILEWSENPEKAMVNAIELNDRYSLDGRDPNGYAGIAWSIGGVHDRAWAERPVFGKVRYMNAAGCRRKFDVDRYINTVMSKYG